MLVLGHDYLNVDSIVVLSICADLKPFPDCIGFFYCWELDGKNCSPPFTDFFKYYALSSFTVSITLVSTSHGLEAIAAACNWCFRLWITIFIHGHASLNLWFSCWAFILSGFKSFSWMHHDILFLGSWW